MKKGFSIGAFDGLQEKLESTLSVSEIKNINIDLLVPSETNIPKLTKMEELKDDIKEYGLYHNLLVKEIEGGKYRIVSGHRRHKALQELGIKEVPCKIIDKSIPDVDVEIMMIKANITVRDEDEEVKRKQIDRLEKLYKEKKKNGEKIPGRIRDKIGESFEMTGSQVQKYMQINKKLIPELQELFDAKKITVTKAFNFTSYTEEQQKEIYNLMIENLDNKEQIIKDLSDKLDKKSDEVKIKEQENEKLNVQIKELRDDILLKDDKISNINVEMENIKNEIISEEKNRNEKETNDLKKKLDKLEKEKNKIISEKQTLKNELDTIKASAVINKENEEIDINVKVVLSSIKDLVGKLNIDDIDNYSPSSEVKQLVTELKEKELKILENLIK